MASEGIEQSEAPRSRNGVDPEEFRTRVNELHDSKVWSGLQARWIWQDRLMWSRAQILLGVQTVAIAAGYQLGDPAGVLVLTLAATLSLILLQLARLDEKNRGITASLMDSILQSHLPGDTTSGVWWDRLTSGGVLLKVVIGGFALIDLTFAGVILAR